MAGFTNYLEQKIADHWFGATTYTPPATVYVGLYTTLPDDSGVGGAEPVGSGYARVSVTNNSTNWRNASHGGTTGSRKYNATTITFPAATAAWGVIAGYGIFDAASGGNLLAFNAISPTLDVASGSIVKFDPDAIAISIDIGGGAFTDHFQNKIIDWLFGGGTGTPPANWFIGLLTVAADAVGNHTEVANANNYSRITHANSAANFSPATFDSGTNKWAKTGVAAVNPSFPAPSGAWGNVVGWGLWDSGTTSGSGNLCLTGTHYTVAPVGGDTVSWDGDNGTTYFYID